MRADWVFLHIPAFCSLKILQHWAEALHTCLAESSTCIQLFSVFLHKTIKYLALKYRLTRTWHSARRNDNHLPVGQPLPAHAPHSSLPVYTCHSLLPLYLSPSPKVTAIRVLRILCGSSAPVPFPSSPFLSVCCKEVQQNCCCKGRL